MIDSTKYINIFIDHQRPEIKQVTILRKVRVLRFLFEYLELIDIQDLYDVTKMNVYDFLLTKSWRSQTKSHAQFVLREFFNYMKEEALTQFDGYDLYPIIITNKRDSILSYYSEEQIRKMIDSIDTSCKCGIRDKCMITIAACTGLRASDIVFLTFSEIKWDKNIISKIQRKTGVLIEIPITDQIKFLLIDYLKNHHPNINSEYIFINSVNNLPFKDAKILTNIIKKAFLKANIDISRKKAGAHSLRHSLATNMLKNNTPLPIIKEVLGHTNINTTERYISVDIEGLRRMSLEVPTYD
ncbi:tyrosine-type recombinase/integrase [Catenibacterium sp.]|uniref:tyrosine-type recombinase/integrase n=1 Tax=Catenibacterium sp. TaxID=2049022 RepID=UPI00258DD50A|nr:tyrosine-type recombinase/integrase [Catenibacterium sp.]MEE0618395.1 tyrosine-type recombinase/integrase [Intestinibacter bartlettii]